MLVKLAVLGAIGYFGYKYLQGQTGDGGASTAPRIALAGGPLSSNATVQHTADAPPAGWAG